MSKAQHTPGPWKILPEECTKPYIRIRGTVFGGRYKVANVLSPSYEGINDREREETVANAHLIAAAPETHESNIWLLDAVRSLIAGKPVRDLEERIAFAEKAIAKAKGEQP